MQKVRQEESSHQLEHSQTKADTPDSLVRDGEPEILPSPSSKAWLCNIKRCAFIFMILLSSSLLISYTNSQEGVHVIPITHQTATQPDMFNFLVYCPLSYKTPQLLQRASQETPHKEGDQLRRRLLVPSEYSNIITPKNNDKGKPLDLSRTFQIEVRSLEYTDSKGIKSTQLFYCSIVRDFYKTCNEAYIACSSPGPMFDIPAREHIDVVWINSLDSSLVPKVGRNCMNRTYSLLNKKYCTLMGKIQKQQTYYDPTQPSATTQSPIMKDMLISKSNWPMTTHVHGAEIRPTFDGNPLSWIDNSQVDKGHLGMGTLSIDDKCYYESFESIDSKTKQSYLPPSISVKDLSSGREVINNMYKINRYPNLQNPGMLWYHDHAMHLTSYNVAKGLSGFFILRDKLVEQKLNIPKEYEKLVMFTVHGLMGRTTLERLQHSTVYRFRFLNNNFDDKDGDVLKISFSYKNCEDKYELRENFTTIGADSSLFNESLDYQTSFVLTQAQRMELLIVFDPNKGNISICGDKDIQYGVKKSSSNPPQKSHPKDNIQTNEQQKASQKLDVFSCYGIEIVKPADESRMVSYQSITQLILDVPFTNLSKVQDSQIAVKRMRPLIWMGQSVFTINGRVDYHSGRSENPTIGTIQDWFIINTIFFAHPIHVHLINFQVIASYDVRRVVTKNAECALYELDFVLTAIQQSQKAKTKYKKAFVGGGYDYKYLCQNRYAIQRDPLLKDIFNQIFPEDQIDQNRISGINSILKIKEISSFNKTNYINLTLNPPIKWQNTNQMLYVVPNNDLDYKPYYRRWKDTAYVDAFKMLHYRMRWTKSNYTEKEDKPRGAYFHVPADQLREYPGFVYHCHILDHEDNEMMRPIMMQLPSDYQLDPNIPCNYEDGKPLLKWSEKYQCINERCRNS